LESIHRRNTIVTDIAEELRAKILSGELKPGEFLESQKILAEQYGVGLSTVRESIQNLAAVGLVESHPGKGTWVRENALNTVFNPITVKARLGELNARQVYEARALIEVGLTGFAAGRATPSDIQAIYNTLNAMQAAADDEQFVQADLAFHFAVAAAAHNELLEQFYHLIRNLLSEVITEMVQLPEVKSESISLQRFIAEAIQDGKAVAAISAAKKHMDYIESLLNLYN
jgi:GntR family transcriptional repressor for pyruvate dehydrogenase complex